MGIFFASVFVGRQHNLHTDRQTASIHLLQLMYSDFRSLYFFLGVFVMFCWHLYLVLHKSLSLTLPVYLMARLSKLWGTWGVDQVTRCCSKRVVWGVPGWHPHPSTEVGMRLGWGHTRFVPSQGAACTTSRPLAWLAVERHGFLTTFFRLLMFYS